MNVDILSFPLPSFECVLDRYPAFFEETIPAREAADMMGKSIAALAQMRCRNVGPHYVKVGASILYRRRDVIEWLQRHVRRTIDSDGGEG